MNSEDQIIQKQNRKFGQDRLKIKIDFTPEHQFLENCNQDESHPTFESKYEEGPAIGQGAHAVVKIVWKKGTNQKKSYAAKIVRSGDCEIQDSVQRTFNTVEQLRHPGIIKVKELFVEEKSETSYLIMEHCRFPSLESHLKSNATLSVPLVKKVFASLFNAVSYMHEMSVCHRDLKPDNILVNLKTGAIKIVDFGVSSYCTQAMWTKTGNPYYGAPEIHTKCGYSEKIDIWALGVILFQCLTGCLPFHESQSIQTIHKITNPDYVDHWEMAEFKELGSSAQDLLMKMLDRNPEQRLSAKCNEAECWEHGFVSEKSHSDLGELWCYDIRSRSNDSLEEIAFESSLNSSLDFKPQIHRVKGRGGGGAIDLVSSFHLLSGSQSRVQLNTNSSEDLVGLIHSHNYQKSNSHDNLGQFLMMENGHDTSLDLVLGQKHHQNEPIINIMEEDDEDI